MTTLRALVAATLAAAILALAVHPAPAAANGAASTRNLLVLGGAAAAYLIIAHNRKVHEQEAQDAQRQASAQRQRNNAWAAYGQAERAYRAEVAVNRELQREIADQQALVTQQQRELASLSVHEDVQGSTPGDVAMVSYGWGTI